MKTSMDLFNEYVEKHQPHGQKSLAELCGVSQTHVAVWKRNGKLPVAATVKVALDLGYSELDAYKIAAIEAERTEEGRDFLEELATAGVARTMIRLAERVGFEPTVRYNRTPDFESGAFDHSATFPSSQLLYAPHSE